MPGRDGILHNSVSSLLALQSPDKDRDHLFQRTLFVIGAKLLREGSADPRGRQMIIPDAKLATSLGYRLNERTRLRCRPAF